MQSTGITYANTLRDPEIKLISFVYLETPLCGKRNWRDTTYDECALIVLLVDRRESAYELSSLNGYTSELSIHKVHKALLREQVCVFILETNGQTSEPDFSMKILHCE